MFPRAAPTQWPRFHSRAGSDDINEWFNSRLGIILFVCLSNIPSVYSFVRHESTCIRSFAECLEVHWSGYASQNRVWRFCEARDVIWRCEFCVHVDLANGRKEKSRELSYTKYKVVRSVEMFCRFFSSHVYRGVSQHCVFLWPTSTLYRRFSSNAIDSKVEAGFTLMEIKVSNFLFVSDLYCF